MSKADKISSSHKTKLTVKQSRFAELCVLYDNKSKAYREVYSCKNMSDEVINKEASLLSKNRNVSVRIAELQQEVSKVAKEKFNIEAEYIIKGFVDIANNDRKRIPIKRWDDKKQKYVSELDEHGNPVYRINNSSSALKALENLGKIKGVYEVDNKQKIEPKERKIIIEYGGDAD